MEDTLYAISVIQFNVTEKRISEADLVFTLTLHTTISINGRSEKQQQESKLSKKTTSHNKLHLLGPVSKNLPCSFHSLVVSGLSFSWLLEVTGDHIFSCDFWH